MGNPTTLEDLIGIEHSKLGFYQELQQKIALLKKSNLQLEEKRKENQALLDGITDLMMVLSEDLTIQRVNHVFTRWYPGVNPIGMRCHQILCNQSEPLETCPALKALKRDEVVKELLIHKVEGRYRQYEIIASPLNRAPAGERQVLVFKRDVTLEKEYQSQFYQAEKMATVGTLAAGVAHEINNPLTAINGFAQGLDRRIRKIRGQIDPDLEQEFKEYTDTIIKECGRCRDIVRTLLTFSRPKAVALSPVDINTCVSDTLFILKHHFKQRQDLVVETNLTKPLPLIRGDESQLKQVIINLMTNAFDATADKGTIEISTQVEKNGRVSLAIRDDGCGIPVEDQDKLFEPFFTTKPVGTGVGIGLSTCYAIVKSHEGDIHVSSRPDSGSVFTVCFPEMKS